MGGTMSVDGRRPQTAEAISRSGRARLRLLSVARDSLSGTTPFTVTFGQVAAKLGGALGGMIHLRDPRQVGIHLVASVGHPLPMGWETLTEEDSAAPVSCLRYGTSVWTPPPPGVFQWPHSPSSPQPPSSAPRRRHASAWKRCGVSALDHGRREALVALSVPAGTHGDLDSTQHDFLRLVADWVAEHLPSARPAATNAGQEVEAVGRDALGGAAWQR
ncbi:hypothetical protein GCM10010390_15410 [Streptomyces mordarskii]|uniref:Uncharacterized protein n=1 Tax=Streptomyces mordarskii TaxID=1226758 RepID=A0ABN1C9F9_9ACTN